MNSIIKYRVLLFSILIIKSHRYFVHATTNKILNNAKMLHGKKEISGTHQGRMSYYDYDLLFDELFQTDEDAIKCAQEIYDFTFLNEESLQEFFDTYDPFYYDFNNDEGGECIWKEDGSIHCDLSSKVEVEGPYDEAESICVDKIGGEFYLLNANMTSCFIQLQSNDPLVYFDYSLINLPLCIPNNACGNERTTRFVYSTLWTAHMGCEFVDGDDNLVGGVSSQTTSGGSSTFSWNEKVVIRSFILIVMAIMLFL